METDTIGAAYEAGAQEAWKRGCGGHRGTEHSRVPIGYATQGGQNAVRHVGKSCQLALFDGRVQDEDAALLANEGVERWQ